MSAKSVESFSQPWISFLDILWIIVKTKGSVKSLLKLLPGGIISRTHINTFFICNCEFVIWKSWQIWLYKFILTKIIIWWITCKRTWKQKTIFKNNNSATTTVVRSDKARTRGFKLYGNLHWGWGELGRQKLQVPLLYSGID